MYRGKTMETTDQCGRYKLKTNRGNAVGHMVHLNPASSLPPVDCPLVIELPSGLLVRATRTAFVKQQDDLLTYTLADGTTVIGRYRWSYP